jgi:hypothetical protein
VVLVQKLAPAAVAKLRHHLGRADDVREQYGRQHPIGLELFPLSGSDLGAEPLDLGEERIRVADCRGEVAAGKLDKPGAGNLLARYRAPRMSSLANSVRCRTSVGTRIDPSTPRTSTSRFIRM